MGVTIRVPDSVTWSAYKRFSWGAVGLFAHTLQGGQRWVFLLRVGRVRFGYRTRGSSSKSHATYYDGGFHWPWKHRTCSGRG